MKNVSIFQNLWKNSIDGLKKVTELELFESEIQKMNGKCHCIDVLTPGHPSAGIFKMDLRIT